MISEKTDLSQDLKEMEFKLNEQIEVNAKLERVHQLKVEELSDANSLLTTQLQQTRDCLQDGEGDMAYI